MESSINEEASGWYLRRLLTFVQRTLQVRIRWESFYRILFYCVYIISDRPSTDTSRRWKDYRSYEIILGVCNTNERTRNCVLQTTYLAATWQLLREKTNAHTHPVSLVDEASTFLWLANCFCFSQRTFVCLFFCQTRTRFPGTIDAAASMVPGNPGLFNHEWTYRYFFTENASKCICLVCRESLAVPSRVPRQQLQCPFEFEEANEIWELKAKVTCRATNLHKSKKHVWSSYEGFFADISTDSSFRSSTYWWWLHKKVCSDCFWRNVPGQEVGLPKSELIKNDCTAMCAI